MGIIGKTYEYLDGSMLKLAESTLRAYNWATGRDKFSLSNVLAFSGLGLCSVNDIFFQDPPTFLRPGLIYPICCYFKMDYTNDFKKIERNCLEKREAIGLDLIKKKEFSQFMSGIFLYGLLPFSLFQVFKEINDERFYESVGSFLLSTGIFSLGLSEQVLRITNLPPRKNLVRRSVEKFQDIYRGIRESVSPKPATSAVNLREDCGVQGSELERMV